MFEQFLGKKCEAHIAGFGSSYGQIYCGILESYDKDYLLIASKKSKTLISIKTLLALTIVD